MNLTNPSPALSSHKEKFPRAALSTHLHKHHVDELEQEDP